MTGPRAALLVFVAGSTILFFAEATWLRVLSALVLFIYIGLGAWTILTPEMLEGEAEDGPPDDAGGRRDPASDRP